MDIILYEKIMLNLMRWKDIYGLKIYTSILSMNFKTNSQKRKGNAKDSRQIYNFMKYGKNAALIQHNIEKIGDIWKVSDIVAIPASSLMPNQLQKLFGLKIERTTNVLPRKTRHSMGLPSTYNKTYIIHHEQIHGLRILLIDDICTTGRTMNHFASVLTGLRYEVVKLVLGLDYKLNVIEDKIVSSPHIHQQTVIYNANVLKLFDDIQTSLSKIENQ